MPSSMNPILEAVRESFEGLLASATSEMQSEQACDVPVALHYEVKRKVIERMPESGLVQVANILSCREWKARPFDAVYLEAERRAIRNKRLIVERYFIGTVDEFTDADVIANLEKHQEAGVRVRHVYITPEMTRQPDFNRDIGYHQTEPPCLTEGIREEGFMWKGFVATSDYYSGDAERIIRILKQHSPAYHAREMGTAREQAVDRSIAGWTRFWHEQSAVANGNGHSLMLEKRLEKIIRELLNVRRNRSQFSIIDAGCGDGKNLVFCVDLCNRLATEFPNIKFDITGADICTRAVDLCERRLHLMSKESNVEARVLQRDISIDIPAVTDSVDVLFLSDAFIHIYPTELKYALAEWRRVLRRRGRLLFNVNRQEDDIFTDCRAAAEKKEAGCEEVTEYMPAWWFRDTFFRCYSEQNVSDMLREAGFAVNSINEEDRQEPAHGRFRDKEHWHRNRIIDAFSID